MKVIQNIGLALITSGILMFSAWVVADTSKGEPYTFVIVHGATGGGWDWKVVANKLIEQGHTVYRPTLTGLGERQHLASADIDLSTHIDDVVNTILFEQLNEVVLVGHSYGGMVITGVMNKIPQRIRHITFLDAAAPDHGMSANDVWGPLPADMKIVDGLIHFPWIDQTAPFPRDVVHPLKSFAEPVAFNNEQAKAINATFVIFVPEGMSETDRQEDPSWRRAKARNWTLRSFSGDHVIYRVKPKEIAALLIDSVNDVNGK
jgi:pimeloyl-ACP methyl ester carboxylesterase